MLQGTAGTVTPEPGAARLRPAFGPRGQLELANEPLGIVTAGDGKPVLIANWQSHFARARHTSEPGDIAAY